VFYLNFVWSQSLEQYVDGWIYYFVRRTVKEFTERMRTIKDLL